jgi:hypothetical protein
VGLDVFSSVGIPSPFPQPHPESPFCSLSPAGVLFPPSISTPFSPLSQVSREICVTGEPHISVSPVNESLVVSSSAELTFPLETASSFTTSSWKFCGTPSISGNQSSSGTQSPEGSKIRYSLHNMVVLTEDLGSCGAKDPLKSSLGSLPRDLSSSRGRGRRSHILLAQDRAKIDVASSRKSSIEWALRAKKPQEVVSL